MRKMYFLLKNCEAVLKETLVILPGMSNVVCREILVFLEVWRPA
jgi:hypothetical protein